MLSSQLECYRFAFANLLHQWQFYQLRVEVLALTEAADQRLPGVALDRLSLASGLLMDNANLGELHPRCHFC